MKICVTPAGGILHAVSFRLIRKPVATFVGHFAKTCWEAVDADGTTQLDDEVLHSAPRVLHVDGVDRTPSHRVFSHTFAHISSLFTCTAWLKVSHDVSS